MEKAAHKKSLLTPEPSLYVQSLYPVDTTEFELTSIEKLISQVGGSHAYQFRSLIVFNLVWFLTSWVLVGQTFYFDNSFTCFDTEDQAECQKFICSISPSQRGQAIKSHANSIVFGFQTDYLICQNDDIRTMLQSLLYGGSLLGFLIIPFLADNWGRRIAIRTSWGLFVLGILFVSIANSYVLVGFGQFLLGFGCNPAITLCYSFLNEQVTGRKRQSYGVIILICLAVGECSIAFLFIPQYDWRTVFYILFLLAVVTWLALNYLLQSPKFLLFKSEEETCAVLNDMAKINKKVPLNEQDFEEVKSQTHKSTNWVTIYDLFRYRSLKWTTMAVGVVFLASQIIYMGTLFSLLQIGYTRLVSQQMIGISEGLGYCFTELFISKMTRKKSSMVGLGLTSIFCFILVMMIKFQEEVNLETMKNIETVGLVASRAILCAFLGIFYVYMAELFPTRVRTIGLGWASLIGTVGRLISPKVLAWMNKAKINFWIFPGIFGIGGFLSLMFLKETWGKPLQDQIDEVRILRSMQVLNEGMHNINI